MHYTLYSSIACGQITTSANSPYALRASELTGQLCHTFLIAGR
jgi:hypothetical protein